MSKKRWFFNKEYVLTTIFLYYATISFEEKSYTKISGKFCKTTFKKLSSNHKKPFIVATTSTTAVYYGATWIANQSKS